MGCASSKSTPIVDSIGTGANDLDDGTSSLLRHRTEVTKKVTNQVCDDKRTTTKTDGSNATETECGSSGMKILAIEVDEDNRDELQDNQVPVKLSLGVGDSENYAGGNNPPIPEDYTGDESSGGYGNEGRCECAQSDPQTYFDTLRSDAVGQFSENGYRYEDYASSGVDDRDDGALSDSNTARTEESRRFEYAESVDSPARRPRVEAATSETRESDSLRTPVEYCECTFNANRANISATDTTCSRCERHDGADGNRPAATEYNHAGTTTTTATATATATTNDSTWTGTGVTDKATEEDTRDDNNGYSVRPPTSNRNTNENASTMRTDDDGSNDDVADYAAEADDDVYSNRVRDDADHRQDEYGRANAVESRPPDAESGEAARFDDTVKSACCPVDSTSWQYDDSTGTNATSTSTSPRKGDAANTVGRASDDDDDDDDDWAANTFAWDNGDVATLRSTCSCAGTPTSANTINCRCDCGADWRTIRAADTTTRSNSAGGGGASFADETPNTRPSCDPTTTDCCWVCTDPQTDRFNGAYSDTVDSAYSARCGCCDSSDRRTAFSNRARNTVRSQESVASDSDYDATTEVPCMLNFNFLNSSDECDRGGRFDICDCLTQNLIQIQLR